MDGTDRRAQEQPATAPTRADAPPRRVLALGDNLFFGARIEAAASGLGYAFEFAMDAEDFRRRVRHGRPGLVLVDMSSPSLPWEALVRELKSTPDTAAVPVVAFGRHTQPEQFKLARRAGCERALTNAQLTQELPDLLRRYLGPGRSAGG